MGFHRQLLQTDMENGLLFVWSKADARARARECVCVCVWILRLAFDIISMDNDRNVYSHKFVSVWKYKIKSKNTDGK